MKRWIYGTVCAIGLFVSLQASACGDLDLACKQKEGQINLPIRIPPVDPECRGDLCRAAQRAGEAGKEAANNIKRETVKLGEDTLTTIRNAGGDTVRTLQQGSGDTVATLQKAGSDTVNTFVKAGKDATATYVKGWKDTAEQSKRSFQDTVDAGTAATNYTINQLKAYESAATSTQTLK